MKHVLAVLSVSFFLCSASVEDTSVSDSKAATGPTFYFVRHGQTDWNVQELRQGHADPALNECGRQQARDLKARWAGLTFDACFASDLQRAFVTADILTSRDLLVDDFVSACSIEDITKDARLRDRNYGVLEGASMEEYNNASGEQRATIESRDEFFDRVTAFLNEMQTSLSSLQSGNVLVVTHGGVMRILLSIMFNIPVTPNDNGVVANTGFFKAQFSGTEWVVEEMYGITLPDMSELVSGSVAAR